MKNRRARVEKWNRRSEKRPMSKMAAAGLSLCLFLSFFPRPLPVHASGIEPPDLTGDKKYSIKVMMVYDDKTVEGGSFEAYRVGEIVKLKTYGKAAGGSSAQEVETAGEAYRFWPTESLIHSMGLKEEEIREINGIDREEDPDAESKLNEILSGKLAGSELNGIRTAEQKEKLAAALAAYVQHPAKQEETGSEERGAAAAKTGEGGAETGEGGARTGEGGAETGEGGARTGEGGARTGEDGAETGEGGARTGEGGAETGEGDPGAGDDDNSGNEPVPPDLWGDNHVQRANEDGVATFEDLRTGLYLFTQSAEQASPGYYPVEPFLVSVPVYDSEYNYNVQAFPNEHEVKIYVKFRLMAIEPDPPDPPDSPDPPDPPDPPPPGPGPDPDPDPDPGPGIVRWVEEYLADPLTIGEPKTQPRLPQTGQVNWPVPVLTAGGAAMFLCGMLLRLYGRKNRAGRRKEEE